MRLRNAISRALVRYLPTGVGPNSRRGAARHLLSRAPAAVATRSAKMLWRCFGPLMRHSVRRAFARVPAAVRENELSVIITSAGRGHLLERTLTTLRENLHFEGRVRWMIIDDLPHEPTRRYIRSQPFDMILFNDRNMGLGRSLTRIYSALKTRWYFHCEDDWEFLRPFEIAPLRALMEAEPDLGQMVLHRVQPLQPPGEVIERDGYVEYPAWYSFNPHLGRFDTMIQGFPFELRYAEKRLTRCMRSRGVRTGIYGWSEDPYVTHTGDERTAVWY